MLFFHLLVVAFLGLWALICGEKIAKFVTTYLNQSTNYVICIQGHQGFVFESKISMKLRYLTKYVLQELVDFW